MTSFGFGQRQCLGQTLTQDELHLACGGLLWAFNLKRKIDPKTGLEIDPPLDKSNSLLIIKPDPFQMAFEPRSAEKKTQTIEQWLEEKQRRQRRPRRSTEAHSRCKQRRSVREELYCTKTCVCGQIFLFVAVLASTW